MARQPGERVDSRGITGAVSMKHKRVLLLICMGIFLGLTAISQQRGPQTFTPSRTPDGQPNIQGYYDNGAGSAPWDIEPHPASFTVPAGDGIIVDPPDRKIPYKPEALAKRNDLRDHHIFDDPQGHCAPSGVPRQMYTPFGFQI